MKDAIAFNDEIVQLRAEVVKLNAQRYALRMKMEDAGLPGNTIRQAIGFARIEIDYASDYERDMYQVWYVLEQKLGYQRYSVQEVDGALLRSNVPAGELRYQLAESMDTELTRRFYDELTGIKLPPAQNP